VEHAEVVVLGAGVVGLSAARALARAGVRVLVIERRRVGAEASTAAAGIVAAQTECDGESPLLDLALRARERHQTLAAELLEETGIPVDLAQRGAIDLAFNDDEERALDARLRWQRSRGLRVDALGPQELREAEPNLSPSARRGLYYAEDHWLDNVRLTRALAASAVARRAAILCGRPVTALLVEAGRVAGVRAGSETIQAPTVINATGAWAGLLGGDPLPPPVEPVRGQIAAFELTPPLFRHVLFSPRGYLVPRADGRLLAGSTAERAGFEKSVTAGGLFRILELALEIAPLLADVRVADAWAGLRPGTPDGLPVIGAGALPGLFHAAGLFRNGILLGPLVGERVARLALGQDPGIDLSAFALGRFGTRPAERAYVD
jgi:glycine oxidase